MMLHMAKEMFSNRIDSDLTDALKLEALSESRSVANMLEWILRDRYSRGAVLTERGGSRPDGRAGVQPAGPADAPGPSPAPRSVSAAVPPTVHGVTMGSVARDLALRDGRCSADVARGTKCKLCGKVHG